MTQWRADKPVTLAGLILIPIVDTRLEGDGGPGGIWLYATKAPKAVVFKAGERSWAMDITGAALPLEGLVDQVPELDGLLKGLN